MPLREVVKNMKSISILNAKTQQASGKMINLRYPYTTQNIEKKVESAVFFYKKAVQYKETFPFNSSISNDWSKILLLSVLYKPVKCIVLAGCDGYQTHLFIISVRTLNREERTALILSASYNLPIELNHGVLSFSVVETLILKWKKEKQIRSVAGMVIAPSGIYRSGEWPLCTLFFEKWFLK